MRRWRPRFRLLPSLLAGALLLALFGLEPESWWRTAAGRLARVGALFSDGARTNPDSDSGAKDSSEWLDGTLESVADIFSDKRLHGKVTRIVDGDTVRFSIEGARQRRIVRLSQIDAPELDQPWGREAKRALDDLVHRQDIVLRYEGVDRYGRMLGRIQLDGQDVGERMVAEGHAWAYRRYMTNYSLLLDELQARWNDRGLWASEGEIAPWEWRRLERR